MSKTKKPEGALQREAKMMKLERLIAERETVSTKTFPIPVKELLTRFEKAYTGAVSDVLREHCLLDQALPGYLRPLDDNQVVAGLAFTVKSAPNVRITGEMSFRTQMLAEMAPDAFIMWDTSKDEKATLWGGVMTATAVGMGIRAACIDGGIRDTHQIKEKNFPVYYKHRMANGSLGRCLITHYQVPIKIGDVLIKPGYVILPHVAGVVCFPPDLAYAVLLRVEEILSNERQIFGWVAEGKTIHQITKKGGYF